MKIDKIDLDIIKAPYLFPFETSFGKSIEKEAIIIRLYSNKIVGYGECTALTAPLYNPETINTCVHMIKDYIGPAILNKDFDNGEDLMEELSFIRGNKIAIAAVEMAFWDLKSKVENKSLKTLLGGTRDEIEGGVSIGIQNNVQELLEKIEQNLKENYHKIKIKIKPGWDVNIIKEVRRYYPDIMLMVDANSAYSLNDVDIFKRLDEYNLLMIEQPLAYDDIIDHAKLQRKISTPICLDESIHSLEDARKAIELGSCKIINIKPSRVGGFYESKRIHDLCQEHNIPVWCGGMLEFGIGRVHNISLASLPNFSIPGDISASKRYFKDDITVPRVDVTSRGTIAVPDENNGIEYNVDEKTIEKYSIEKIQIEGKSY